MLQFVSTQVEAAIERTRAEQALRASEARLTAILRSALDAHVAMDDTGRVTTWNRQAESMFGWTEGEVLGPTPRRHSSYRTPIARLMRRVARFLALARDPFSTSASS